MKSVDLLLVNPFRTNKVGIFTLASYIRSKGFKVAITDGTFEDIAMEIGSYSSIKVLGVTALTTEAEFAYKVCDYFKNKFKDSLCLIGGYHATCSKEEIFKESKFDIIVFGEGEETLYEILSRKKLSEIKGIIYKDKNEIITNPQRDLIQDLDVIPFPAYDLIDMRDYFHHIRHSKGICKKTICLLVSRGCYFDCVFCCSKAMWRRRFRIHSTDYIIELIKKLIDTYDMDSISFLDDELVTNNKKMGDLCDKMIEMGISKKIKWSCHSTVLAINKEILNKMKDAGCVLVRIGIESGNQKTLSYLKSDAFTIERNYEAIKICNGVGINCFASLLVGSPDEDLNSILDTIKFIETSGVNYADVFVATPFPNTKLWDDAVSKGYLEKNLKWKDFFIDEDGMGKKSNPIVKNKYFTAKQILDMKRYIQFNLCDPLDFNKKPKKLNHEKELKKIVEGDTSMCKERSDIKLIKQKNKILRKVKISINNPKKVFHFIKRNIIKAT